MNEKERLTARQQAAVTALATGMTNRDAAAHVGIGEATLYRWLNQPAFLSALENTQQIMLSAAARQLAASLSCAIDTLTSITRDNTVAESVRVTAARSLIEITVKVHGIASIERRLSELEEVMVYELQTAAR
jgi:hypothetical protein